jgi:gag-polypeptide of LTR copia-type
VNLSYSTKVPTFSGKKKEWLFFKTKFESYLAQKGMVALLKWQKEIPKDDVVFPENADEKQLLEKKIQEENRRASGILLGCIVDKDTKEGEAAFHMVDESAGYAGGNFKLAWATMTKRFEDKGTSTVSELNKAYYNLMMDEGEKPDQFIVKMDRARKKLRTDANVNIDDQQYMLDILSRLPEGKDGDNLGPYQVAKRFLEPKITQEESDFTLDDLILELLKVYLDVYGDEDADTP